MELNFTPKGQPLPRGGGPPVLAIRWHARPWLLALAVALLVPSLTLYSAVILRALGLGTPYAAVQTALPAADAPLLLRQATGWAITLVGPVMAAMLTLLASVSGEVWVGQRELVGRVLLAAFASPRLRLVAAVVLLLGLVLFALMAGHLVADGYACLRGMAAAC